MNLKRSHVLLLFFILNFLFENCRDDKDILKFDMEFLKQNSTDYASAAHGLKKRDTNNF